MPPATARWRQLQLISLQAIGPEVCGVSNIVSSTIFGRTLCYICSGGTLVTVFGSNLNSVAEPRITVTVVVTRLHNDSNVTSYENETDSQVTQHRHDRY